MAEKKQDFEIDRRGFLKTSGGVLAGLSVASIAPQTIFAANSEVKDLAILTYEIFPHQQLDIKIYEDVATGFLEKAKKDKNLKKVIEDGLNLANHYWGKPLSSVRKVKRADIMDRLQTTPFYASLRGHAVVALYNDHRVWKKLGYPGSSFEFGGYVNSKENLGKLPWLDKI